MNNQSTVSEKREAATGLSGFRRSASYYLTQPVARLLAKTHVAPNTISWFGFLVTIGAGALIVTEHLFTASFVVLLAGFFDILDGALARSTNQVTRFGAALDSTLDRLAEAVVLLSILVLYAKEQSVAGILIVGVALFGSLLVSYIRAKAEALGLECQVGFFTRAERVIVLALGLLLNQIDYALIIALIIIVVFSLITAGQRMFHIWRQTKIG